MSPSGQWLMLHHSIIAFQIHFPSRLALWLPVIPEGLSASCVQQRWPRPQSQTRSGKWSSGRQSWRARSTLGSTGSASVGADTSHRSQRTWSAWRSCRSTHLWGRENRKTWDPVPRDLQTPQGSCAWSTCLELGFNWYCTGWRSTKDTGGREGARIPMKTWNFFS